MALQTKPVDKPKDKTEAEAPTESYNPSQPPAPEHAWEDYAVQAINMLYPHARNGVDYAWGRKEPGGRAELLDWNPALAKPDMGKIEEVAKKLAAENPVGPNYKPQPSLARGVDKRGIGEVPPKSTS